MASTALKSACSGFQTVFVRLHSPCANSTILTLGKYRAGLEYEAVVIAQSSRCTGDVRHKTCSKSIFCNLFTHTEHFLRTGWKVSAPSRSNWKLELSGMFFSGAPGEKPLGSKERTNNKLNSHVGFKPGHIGGRRVLLPLRHPCSPNVFEWK